jgi:hypothetical protein
MRTLNDIQELKSLSISIGSVFRIEMFPKDRITPKGNASSRNKYIIIIGKDNEDKYVGITIINSKINQNLLKIIGQYQFGLDAYSYPFLNGKSRYVDCYELREMTIERLISQGQYIGLISEEDIEEITKILKTSPKVNTEILIKYNI